MKVFHVGIRALSRLPGVRAENHEHRSRQEKAEKKIVARAYQRDRTGDQLDGKDRLKLDIAGFAEIDEQFDYEADCVSKAVQFEKVDPVAIAIAVSTWPSPKSIIGWKSIFQRAKLNT